MFGKGKYDPLNGTDTPQKEVNWKLFRAAYQGNAEDLAQALHEKANVNQKVEADFIVTNKLPSISTPTSQILPIILYDKNLQSEQNRLSSVSSYALYAAVTGGHIEIVSLLQHAGANPNQLSVTLPLITQPKPATSNTTTVALPLVVQEETALHAAIRQSNLPMIELLLHPKSGKAASLTIRDSNGDTPLLLAAKLGNIEIISTLVKAGASVYDKDTQHQDTPLHACIRYGHFNAITLLLIIINQTPATISFFAVINPLAAINKDGQTPLRLAISLKDKKDNNTIDLLVNGKASVEGISLKDAIATDSISLVEKVLLFSGKKAASIGANHLANVVVPAKPLMVAVLLKHGVVVTPGVISLAVKYSTEQIHKMLLDAQKQQEKNTQSESSYLLRDQKKIDLTLTSSISLLSKNEPDSPSFRNKK